MESKSLVELGRESIVSSSVISDSDLAQLDKIKESLMISVDTRTIWRTQTEAEVSVLNDLKFPTAAAKFHQAAREQVVFFDNLLRLSFDYQRKLLDVEEIQDQLKNADPGSMKARRLNIDLKEAIYTLSVMQHEGRERVREIVMWEDIKQKCLFDDPSIHPDDKNADQIIGFTLSHIRKLPSAFRSATDPGSANNIIGQAISGLKKCDELGINLGKEGLEAKKLLKHHHQVIK